MLLLACYEPAQIHFRSFLFNFWCLKHQFLALYCGTYCHIIAQNEIKERNYEFVVTWLSSTMHSKNISWENYCEALINCFRTDIWCQAYRNKGLYLHCPYGLKLYPHIKSFSVYGFGMQPHHKIAIGGKIKWPWSKVSNIMKIKHI